MAGAGGVKPLLRLGVDMGADYFADEDYMVAGGYLRFEGAFEIGDGIGQQYRIDGVCRFGLTIKLGEFVGVSAGLRAEK